jgi:hypothetical protein
MPFFADFEMCRHKIQTCRHPRGGCLLGGSGTKNIPPAVRCPLLVFGVKYESNDVNEQRTTTYSLSSTNNNGYRRVTIFKKKWWYYVELTGLWQ